MKKTTGAFPAVGTGVGETRGGASCFEVATVHAVIASTGRWISRTTDGERKFAEFDRPPIDLAVEQRRANFHGGRRRVEFRESKFVFLQRNSQEGEANRVVR